MVKETFEDVEADTTELVNVRVIDSGQEPYFWWGHWVILWQEQLQFKLSTYA